MWEIDSMSLGDQRKIKETTLTLGTLMDSVLGIRNSVRWFYLIMLILSLDLWKCCTLWMKVSLIKPRTRKKPTISVFMLLISWGLCQISITRVEWFLSTRSSKKTVSLPWYVSNIILPLSFKHGFSSTSKILSFFCV